MILEQARAARAAALGAAAPTAGRGRGLALPPPALHAPPVASVSPAATEVDSTSRGSGVGGVKVSPAVSAALEKVCFFFFCLFCLFSYEFGCAGSKGKKSLECCKEYSLCR